MCAYPQHSRVHLNPSPSLQCPLAPKITTDMDPTFPLVPIANFAACVLVLCSMSRRMFQSWNIGACSIGLWVAAESFIRAINGIVWSDNVDNVAPYWCDIGQSVSSLQFLQDINPDLSF